MTYAGLKTLTCEAIDKPSLADLSFYFVKKIVDRVLEKPTIQDEATTSNNFLSVAKTSSAKRKGELLAN